MHAKKRHLLALVGIVAGLAVGAPIAGASAADTPDAIPGVPLPDFGGDLSFPDPSAGNVAIALASAAVDSVFNGTTVVQIVNGPADSSIIG